MPETDIVALKDEYVGIRGGAGGMEPKPGGKIVIVKYYYKVAL